MLFSSIGLQHFNKTNLSIKKKMNLSVNSDQRGSVKSRCGDLPVGGDHGDALHLVLKVHLLSLALGPTRHERCRR